MKERLNEEIDMVDKIALKYEGSTGFWKISDVWKMNASDVEKDIITVANGLLKREEDRYPIGDAEVWYDSECTKNNLKKGILEATGKNNWDRLSSLILEESLAYLSKFQSGNQKEDFKVGYGLVRMIKWRMGLAEKEAGKGKIRLK